MIPKEMWMAPKEMCSGTCGGKRENCPAPQACGWPDPEGDDKGFLDVIVFVLAVVSLVVLCFGVMIWL
jgi:hypothetical protein